MENIKKFVEENKKVLIGVLVVLAAILLWVLLIRKEKFVNFAVDMAAAANPDPTLFKYTGRLRSPAGLDEYDNYYENKMLWQQGVADRLQGFPAFEPRVKPVYPAITPNARTGFEKSGQDDTFRESELAWGQARSELKAEKPLAPVTRGQIEARAEAAEHSAALASVGDISAPLPQQDALTEKMTGMY